jgi:tetratricopeptide (TPR) repeat protein
MADILQTPAECLFFSDLLPLVPAQAHPSLAMQLARALRSHGMQEEGWRTDAAVPAFLNELCRHTGAAWLPDSILPALQQSPSPELKEALTRREQIAGRTAFEMLAEAEVRSGAARGALTALLEDAVRAGRIAGTCSEDDATIARCGVRLQNASRMAWAEARPEVEAVEAECRAVRERSVGHMEALLLLGRAVWQRALMTNDRDCPALPRESIELLAAVENDSARASWPAAMASARLGIRSAKGEALRLLEQAEAVLAKPGNPAPLHTANARIELFLARSNFEGDAAALRSLQEALEVWQRAIVQQQDEPAALLLRARILVRRAEREPRAESEKGLTEARQILQTVLALEPSGYDGHILSAHAAAGLAERSAASLAGPLWNQAAVSIESAIALDPNRPEAYSALLVVGEGRAEQSSRLMRGQILEEAWNRVAPEMARFDGFADFRWRLGRLRAAQSKLPGGSQATLALEASGHFEAAAGLMPSEPVNLQNWGDLMVHQARQAPSETLLAGAIAKFREALELRPGYKRALSGWADALATRDGGPVEKEIEAYEAAIAKYGEALEPDAMFRAALLGRANARRLLSWLKPQAEALQLLNDAVKDLEPFLAANAEDARAHQALGRVQYVLAERVGGGDEAPMLDRALESYRRADSLHCDDPGLPIDEGDVLRVQARRLGKPDLFDQALGAYRSVPMDAGRSYVRALIGMGRLQLQRTVGGPRSTPEETSAVWQWLGEARQYFDEAIRLAPESYIARRGMADAWRRVAELMRYQSAEPLGQAQLHLLEALKLRPGDPVALTLLGDVYYLQATLPDIRTDVKWSQLARASHQYAAALAVLPDHFDALMGSGRTGLEIAKMAPSKDTLNRAQEQFERALEARPGDQGAQRQLDLVLQHQSELKVARPPI